MAHRLSNGTQSNVVPTPPPVSGTPGFPSGGDPGSPSGLPSVIDPYWDYSKGEEICNFVTALGGTLDKAQNNQMAAALIATFPGLVGNGRAIGDGSAGSKGYIRLPGGLILQWIRNKATQADGTGAALNTWTFPVAFPTTVLAYSYVATNENAGNTDAGTIQAAAPTQTQHAIAHLRCPPGASVAFSGFILGL